jgi:hypothetical protein
VKWFSLKFRPYGRHSLVLLMAGLSFVAMGISKFFYVPNGPRIQALVIAVEHMPIEAWGIVFISVGILVIISSRWPYHAAGWGYALLTGLSIGWSATYLLGVLLRDSSIGNLTLACYWGLLAFLWWSISGLLNPDRAAELREGEPHEPNPDGEI